MHCHLPAQSDHRPDQVVRAGKSRADHPHRHGILDEQQPPCVPRGRPGENLRLRILLVLRLQPLDVLADKNPLVLANLSDWQTVTAGAVLQVVDDDGWIVDHAVARLA